MTRWFGGALGARVLASALIAAGAGGDAALAQQAACRDTGGFCGRSLSRQCLTSFGAGALGVDQVETAEACEGQLQQYRECLALVSAQCPRSGPLERSAGKTTQHDPGQGGPAASSALEIWNEIKSVEDADVLEAFVKAYPASPLAVLAGKRAAAMRDAAKRGVAPPSPDAAPSAEELAAKREEENLRRAFKEAQGHLNRLGYAAGPEDGRWGDRSARALERFLTDSGGEESGFLTPEALATLRWTSKRDVTAKAKSPAVSEPKKSEAPPRSAAGLTARATVIFRYRDRTKKVCGLTRRVPSKALNFSRVRLSCPGGAKGYLTLRTDASGRAHHAVAELNRDVVSLNGSDWRYNGLRSVGKDPNNLRSAKVSVSF